MKKIYQFHLNILMGILIFISNNSFGQSSFVDINPKWDDYYKANPSGIKDNYQASDFIRVMRRVDFIPIRREIKGNRDLLETGLLGLDQQSLRQMMIDGDYFSRTYKHDDYFYLYNKFYKNVSKEIWDRNCPYLIPLMSLENLVNLH